MKKHPPRPFDFARLRAAVNAKTTCRVGFPTAADYANTPYVVQVEMSRAKLGDAQFERIFALCRAAADELAPGVAIVEAIYKDYERIGYEFRFPTKLAEIRFRLCHEAVMRHQPSPLLLYRKGRQ
jgi:hypothetical protein